MTAPNTGTPATPPPPQIIAVGPAASGAPAPFAATVQTSDGSWIAHFGHSVHDAIECALAWIAQEAKKL
jgi:hypothetical protein